jgi:hypothetical protein
VFGQCVKSSWNARTYKVVRFWTSSFNFSYKTVASGVHSRYCLTASTLPSKCVTCCNIRKLRFATVNNYPVWFVWFSWEIIDYLFPPLPLQRLSPVGQGLINIETSLSHSVGILWTSDQPKADTSTRQHTTLARHRLPCLRRDSNTQSQQPSGHKPTP